MILHTFAVHTREGVGAYYVCIAYVYLTQKIIRRSVLSTQGRLSEGVQHQASGIVKWSCRMEIHTYQCLDTTYTIDESSNIKWSNRNFELQSFQPLFGKILSD